MYQTGWVTFSSLLQCRRPNPMANEVRVGSGRDIGMATPRPLCQQRCKPKRANETTRCPRRGILCKLPRRPGSFWENCDEIFLARLRGRHRPGGSRGCGSRPRAGTGSTGLCNDGRAALANALSTAWAECTTYSAAVGWGRTSFAPMRAFSRSSQRL